jgi:hypothetical protein
MEALTTSPEKSYQALASAQAQWERRPFSHYRLVSEVSTSFPLPITGCQRDLEIQNEQVIYVFRNDCPDWSEAMTVTDIFRLFGGNVPSTVDLRPSPRPGIPTPTAYIPRPTPTGLKPCQNVIVANFDGQLGYPHSIETQIELDRCFILNGPPQYRVKILSLVPIP